MKVDADTLKKQPADHPNISVIRGANLVTKEGESAILDKWEELQKLGGLTYSTHGKGDNRSSTPAVHCGIWHLSANRPLVTTDTRQEKSKPEVRKCLEELCELIKIHVAPHIKRMTQIHAPNVWPKQERYDTFSFP